MDAAETKYRAIFEALRDEILGGKYAKTRKLPSEAQLMRRFGGSRVTVIHALQELRSKGLIVRHKGKGSFITPAAVDYGRAIGLVIPISRGEIFPPICRELTRLAQQDGYAILLADFMATPAESRVDEARRIMEDFVARNVLGVVFHLADGVPDAPRINRAALAVLDAAGIPAVLTDCDCVPFPGRSGYDVVGADDVDAGYRLTRHILGCGARRPAFFMPAYGSVSFANRCRGFTAALDEAKIRGTVVTGDSRDAATVDALMRRFRPDAIVCGNDRVAACLMATLASLGRRVPQDVLLAGFDDVDFARFVSLTTIHQPCADIGRAAYELLLARVRDPAAVPRSVAFAAPLVVRESTAVRNGGRPRGRMRSKRKDRQ